MNRLRVPIAISLLALGAVAAPGYSKPPAQATALTIDPKLYCSSGMHASSYSLSVDDVTFGTIPGSIPTEYYSADDCYGSFNLADSGTATEEKAANEIWNSSFVNFGGGTFTEILRDNGQSATGSFGGATFSLTANTSSNIWTIGWVAANDLTLDLVVMVKTGGGLGDAYASYFFDDQLFGAGNLSDKGSYEVSFTRNGLSHFSVLARNGDAPICTDAPNGICISVPVCTAGVACDQTIPEPATLPILATGLLGLAVLRRRAIRL